MTDGGPERDAIDAELAARLVAEQFPQFGTLPVAPVARSGWDNRTFRLGDDHLVRLPSTGNYIDQVAKEQRWLPELGQHLPLPIPMPEALGTPTSYFPRPWSIYRRIPGNDLIEAPVEPASLASDLGLFLTALYAAPAANGPPPGTHNFLRGAHPRVYDRATRRALEAIDDRSVVPAAIRVWEAALATEWQNDPVWLHGDVSPGNLLQTGGTLSAVIDFGCSGVGDPACALAFAWTQFEGANRLRFLEATGLDQDTALRGAAWAMWKALITLAGAPGPDSSEASSRVVSSILSDYG